MELCKDRDGVSIYSEHIPVGLWASFQVAFPKTKTAGIEFKSGKKPPETEWPRIGNEEEQQ